MHINTFQPALGKVCNAEGVEWTSQLCDHWRSRDGEHTPQGPGHKLNQERSLTARSVFWGCQDSAISILGASN